MIKVGIFGSYNAASIGDFAILQGIIEQLRSRSNDIVFRVFSFACKETRDVLIKYENVYCTPSSPLKATEVWKRSDQLWNLHKNAHKSNFISKSISRFAKMILFVANARFWITKYKEIRDLDLLIIGGGNLLTNLYASWPIYLLIFTMLAKLAGIPIMFYAVGAGPIKGFLGKLIIKLTIGLADYITVRDEESANLLVNKGLLKECIVSADPALVLHPPQQEGSKTRLSAEGALIGVTVVPYFRINDWPYPDMHKYEQYVNWMADILDNMIEKLNCRVVFFGTHYPSDIEVAIEICNRMRRNNKVIVIKERLDVNAVMKLILCCDVIIGTRLHSLILSYICKTPFIGLIYQPKVRSFCRYVGLEDFVFELGERNHEFFLAKLGWILQHKEDIITKMSEKLPWLIKKSNISADLALSLVQKKIQDQKLG
jgi:polysaccharide pyruvyl transferase WcaK-like protein